MSWSGDHTRAGAGRRLRPRACFTPSTVLSAQSIMMRPTAVNGIQPAADGEGMAGHPIPHRSSDLRG